LPTTIEQRALLFAEYRGWSTGSERTLTSTQWRFEMNALWRSTATLAVAATLSLSPAMAQGPRPSGSGAAGLLSPPVDPAAAQITPHYEWQYHYAGRHAHWEGQWVLVNTPTRSTGAGGKL
jgi:hypothetical protein